MTYVTLIDDGSIALQAKPFEEKQREIVNALEVRRNESNVESDLFFNTIFHNAVRSYNLVIAEYAAQHTSLTHSELQYAFDDVLNQTRYMYFWHKSIEFFHSVSKNREEGIELLEYAADMGYEFLGVGTSRIDNLIAFEKEKEEYNALSKKMPSLDSQKLYLEFVKGNIGKIEASLNELSTLNDSMCDKIIQDHGMGIYRAPQELSFLGDEYLILKGDKKTLEEQQQKVIILEDHPRTHYLRWEKLDLQRELKQAVRNENFKKAQHLKEQVGMLNEDIFLIENQL